MKKHIFAMAVVTLAAGSAFAQAGDTLAKIKSSGSITLGVRESSGLSYTLGNGKYVGFHTEMAEHIVSDIRKQLGLSALETKYQPVTSQNRIPLVTNGTVDLECGSTTNNAARQKDVAFAVTTYVEEVRMVVKANSKIASIKDLAGKSVATTTGTTSVQTLRKHERAGGIDFKEVYGKDHADSFLLLETGRADAFVMDGSILAANISKSKAPADYKIVGEVLSVEPIACMMRKDDPAFKKAVDDSIKRQIADGSLAKLYDKWFMQPVPPTNTKIGLPLSDATKAAWANPNDKPMEDYAKK
jgi:glutamate/aspartate transport system substrate-binding protein